MNNVHLTTPIVVRDLLLFFLILIAIISMLVAMFIPFAQATADESASAEDSGQEQEQSTTGEGDEPCFLF